MASGTTGLTSQLRPAVSARPIDREENVKEKKKKKKEQIGAGLDKENLSYTLETFALSDV